MDICACLYCRFQAKIIKVNAFLCFRPFCDKLSVHFKSLRPFHVHLDPFHVYLDPYKPVSILIG